MPRTVHIVSLLRILQAGTSLGDVGLLGRWLQKSATISAQSCATQQQKNDLSFYEDKYLQLLEFEKIHGAGSALNVRGQEIDLMVEDGLYTQAAFEAADKASPFKDEALYSLPPRDLPQEPQDQQ